MISAKGFCAPVYIYMSYSCNIPRRVAGVGQGDVTNSEVMVEPQNRQARVERVTTLDTYHGRYFAAPPRGLNVPSCVDEL